jgi:hypothetical protein
MIITGNTKVLREETVNLPLCQPQPLYGSAWNQTLSSTVNVCYICYFIRTYRSYIVLG